jgi:single-strand DNA-binding protein
VAGRGSDGSDAATTREIDMAFNETKVTVVGRVCTEISTRTTGDGATVATFSVATNERRYDRSTDSWIDRETLFLRVTCWRRLAEGVAASLGKGDPVVVAGRLVARKFEADGQPRTATEIEASSVGPDLTLCTAVIRRGQRQGGGVEVQPTAAAA